MKQKLDLALAVFCAVFIGAVMAAAMTSERKYQAYLLARPAHVHAVQR
jgi:hypothetical protein